MSEQKISHTTRWSPECHEYIASIAKRKKWSFSQAADEIMLKIVQAGGKKPSAQAE